MYKFLVIIFLCFSVQLFGQSSEKYNSEYANFYRGEELFEKSQFGAARYEFRIFINQFTEKEDPLYQKAMYYEGLSALELFNNDGVTLLENFDINYPESVFKYAIYFRLGQYFYQKKDYPEALSWFSKLKASDLENEDVDEFYFKLGYANFQEGKFDAAKAAFYEVKDGVTQYSSPSLYYYSHIAYQNKSYQMALDGFLKIQTNERFSKIVPYYIVQIYHLQGRYDEVVKFAPTVLDTSNLINANDMNHLLGDAYYRLKKYDEAVPYLLEYNRKTKTTRDEDYQLGFSYFKVKMYPEAIKLFDKVTDFKDSLAQTSYYHIGEAYLLQEKLAPARAAFEEASKINKDLKVQEDALYNYAILSYKLDINPYDEAVEALQFYLKKYPDSKRKNDVYQYLVNVYTSTNNYAKALISLDKLQNKDTQLKSAYQLVAFNRGVELYQKVDYKAAITAFELVDKYPIDPVISGKAKFWTADAYFQLKNFDKAIQGYRSFLMLPATLSPELKNDAYYNIGYAYYAKKDTLLGIESFRIYTQQNNLKKKNKLAEANLRAADGYYVTRQNENAIKYYSEVLKLKSGYEDQALYYLARTYGFQDNGSEEKIKHLQDIVNNYKGSKYIQGAVQELGTTYKGIAEYDKAKRYFEQLITDYPNNLYVDRAKIEIADIYFKKGEFSKSELAYRQILLEKGSIREICEVGANGLISIYSALKQPEKALAVQEQYPCAGLTKDQQEELFYSPAKRTYDDTLKPLTLAITEFEKYLAKFPTGIYSNDANNYLADCYYRSNNIDSAIPIYIKTLEQPTTLFTELAAIRVSKYLFNSNKYLEAIPYYERLEKISSNANVIYNSQLSLMKSNFLIENWENGVKYSKIILANASINAKTRQDAQYISGISNYNLNNFPDAKIAFDWLFKNTTTVNAAEAKFLVAEMSFSLKEYEKSEAEIMALTKMKPSYNYWVAKGLILQSKILIIKDDLFQAEETLNSIIDYYKVKDDGIVDEATAALNELMQLKNKEKEIPVKSATEIDLNEEN